MDESDEKALRDHQLGIVAEHVPEVTVAYPDGSEHTFQANVRSTGNGALGGFMVRIIGNHIILVKALEETILPFGSRVKILWLPEN